MMRDPEMAVTLEGDDAGIVKWWVDASFAVHPDMKSQTGGALSLKKGSVYSTSTRQKVNTKSSTKAELVGVDDVMPLILWTRYFLDAQGYGVCKNKVFQDNQSAIILEKNGQRSSSRRTQHINTRHINIRYFFVTDHIQSKELTVKYCPTGKMLADMLTKPLQGNAFCCFCNAVMNLPIGLPRDIPCPGPQECVEENIAGDGQTFGERSLDRRRGAEAQVKRNERLHILFSKSGLFPSSHAVAPVLGHSAVVSY
jgi:hypothetical protein